MLRWGLLIAGLGGIAVAVLAVHARPLLVPVALAAPVVLALAAMVVSSREPDRDGRIERPGGDVTNVRHLLPRDRRGPGGRAA